MFCSGPLNNQYVSAINTDGGIAWGTTRKCGECYEVACVDGPRRGLQSSAEGPWGGCRASGRKSVVVMITDSCPCQHPNPGNQKWCCGDRTHLDLSWKAFEAIGEMHGIISHWY